MDIEKLSVFCDAFVKDEKAYFLLKQFVLNIINEQTKKYAKEGALIAENWVDLYQEAIQIFNQTDALYLDKKQMIMKLFFKIAEEIK